jgi:hypothetical protein
MRAAMRCTVTPFWTVVLTPFAPGVAGVVVMTSTS